MGETRANRVFVGYPWNPYKTMWERLLADLHRRFPLHFLAVGREPGQAAAQLFTRITRALDGCSTAIFDASTGNPNVSLEYGYFRAKRGEETAYLFLDEDAKVRKGVNPIISDLAGAIANRYRPTDTRLQLAMEAICSRHPYVIRFKRFCRQRGYKGGTRKFLVRMLRHLDGRDSMLRRELLDDLAHETGKTERYLDRFLKELHAGGLLTVSRGNQFASRVSVSE